MADDLSRLSSEDIRRFEKTVSEAKALTARQEEIAKKVLEFEKDIGRVRLASLEEYFDAYSKGLDDIIARKTSQLNDAFLIMEQKALEGYKKASNTTFEEFKRNNNNNQNTSTKSSSANTESASNSTPAQTNTRNKSAGQTVSDAAIDKLGSYHAAEDIAARFNKYKSTFEQIKAINEEQADAIFTLQQLEEARGAKREEQLESYREKEDRLAKSQLNSISSASSSNTT
jgi:hypothetical protein